MKILWRVTLSVILTCGAISHAGQYAGWTAGDVWNGHGAILRTFDSGNTWRQQGLGQIAPVNMAGVFAVDPFKAWVVGEPDSGYATIYHTTDGGENWARKGFGQVPLQGVELAKVHTFGDKKVWAVGVGTILHTPDGGATWTNQIPAGYESTPLQGVYTPDGGDTWVEQGIAGQTLPALWTISFSRQAVPEPSTAAMLISAAGFIIFTRRRD